MQTTAFGIETRVSGRGSLKIDIGHWWYITLLFQIFFECQKTLSVEIINVAWMVIAIFNMTIISIFPGVII